MVLIYNSHQNNNREGPNTGCQNVVIKAFPVMIATLEESTPCSIPYHGSLLHPLKPPNPYIVPFLPFFAVASPESYPCSCCVL